MSDIDFVIIWVDGNDPQWQAEKAIYDNRVAGDNRVNRFRSWDNLHYWFRGVEKYAPWVRKIHFVTWGHLPAWLNTANPKLQIVKHEDYIPAAYRPTFNSHTIELNLHRIDGLAQRFLYFNDDMFLTSELFQEDIFRDGLPCDSALETVQTFVKGGIDHIIASNLEVINHHFNKREAINRNPSKWYTPKYGKGMLKNLYLYPFKRFVGFFNSHLPYAYLKTTFEQVWDKEFSTLNETCLHRFRQPLDVNQWLMRYWQLASGSFIPVAPKLGRFFSIGRDDIDIEKAIKKRQYKMICLSDDDTNIDYDAQKARINAWFDHILPNKSSFER
jgi:hypothetical protein